MWVVLAAFGQYRPHDSRQFVRQRARDDIGVSTRQKLPNPRPNGVFPLIDMLHDGSRALHQQLADVLVAALADPQKHCLSARRILPRHQP